MSEFKLLSIQIIQWMLDNWPEELEIMPFWLRDLARQNDKRPAQVTVSVPDDWVKNLKGKKEFVNTYLILKVPVELFQRWTRERRGLAIDHVVNAAKDIEAESEGGGTTGLVGPSNGQCGFDSRNGETDAPKVSGPGSIPGPSLCIEGVEEASPPITPVQDEAFSASPGLAEDLQPQMEPPHPV